MNILLDRFKNSKVVTAGLILALFVAINWLSYALYIRFDLSGTGRFRLTSASKQILRNLPERVTIEAYFSKDISEAYYQPVKQLRDFLQEYASSSRGKVKLVFLNPDEDETIQQKARSLGIQPMPLGSVDKKKREVSKVFLSLAIYYEDKTQVIPDILRQSQALEYFLTANIYKLAHPLERNVGYLDTDNGFSKTQQDNPFLTFDILNRSLETFYGDMIAIKADQEDIPANISVLFILSPKALSEIEKYHVDQFIMRGGKVILAMNGVDINFNNLMTSPRNPDVLEFFKNYGIDVKADMVFDAKNYVPFRQPVNILQMIELPYPVWLVSPTESLAENTLLTENFKFLIFPWASSVTIDPARVQNGKITQLASSSTNSWLKSEAYTVNPEFLKDSIENQASSSEMKSHALAFDIKGKFASYFNNHKLPTEIKDFLPNSVNESEIVVVSTPFAFTNNIQPIQITQNLNINFFLTILDVMNGFDELVKSRNRNQTENPTIGPIDLWLKNIITVMNFLLPLLFIAGYGLLRLITRKKLSQKIYSDILEITESKGDNNV